MKWKNWRHDEQMKCMKCTKKVENWAWAVVVHFNWFFSIDFTRESLPIKDTILCFWWKKISIDNVSMCSTWKWTNERCWDAVRRAWYRFCSQNIHVIWFHLKSKNIAILYENCLQLFHFLVFIRHWGEREIDRIWEHFTID